MNRLADNAATVGGCSSCRFVLDPAAPWGAVDSRAMDWAPYGIADFDLLDNDRKLLLCMAAYYTDFDFDSLFKKGDREAAVDGLDLKDAVKLVQPIEKARCAARSCAGRHLREDGRLASSGSSIG